MATIQVTVEDFVNSHGSLVHLLKTLEKAEPEGLTTRDLCDISFNNRKRVIKLIKEAEKAGYIRRFSMHKVNHKKRTNSRGRYYVMNTLTPTGKKLLSKLGDF
jgi:hypothetical protein